MNKALNIVWLKRDLRTQDHLPLFYAEQATEDYLIIYIFEPSALAYPDCSIRHCQFIYHSIQVMNERLEQYNRNVHVFHAEAVDVFNYLFENYDIKNVFSHQETGILTTWQRDKMIAELLQKIILHGMSFKEVA